MYNETQVLQALADLREGKMIILSDDPSRENEGDLIVAAEKLTVPQMNFILRHSSGVVCLSLPEEKLQALQLPLMVPPTQNSSVRGTPFTISIDARDDITTGVSAADRVTTILKAIEEPSQADALVKPGHIFPLQAHPEGVFGRAGHTEGALDLVKAAGLKPAAVLCEIMNPDGSMTQGEQLKAFAETHQLSMLSISDLMHYRRRHENFISEVTQANLPLETYGDFTISVIKEKYSQQEHVILSKPWKANTAPLVRLHSACLTGDLFHSLRCDCHDQLHYALSLMKEQGGLLIYLNQEGRGIGLFNKIKAYALQEEGLDTVEANQKLGLPVDSRDYAIAANYLRNQGIQSFVLLSNNPLKANALASYGDFQIERQALPAFCNVHNQQYLSTKKTKLHHQLRLDNDA